MHLRRAIRTSKAVTCLDELVSTPLEGGVNALYWPRTLPGDFGEIVEALGPGVGIIPVDEACLADLPLSDAGRVARDLLLADQQGLRAFDLQPGLDCVHGSVREAPEGLFHTDVHSFHVDTATVPADTYLCTYFGTPSDGLRNDEAVRRADVPETRAELLKLYGGPDDVGFLEYLAENFYDLHYVPRPEARSFSFGLGKPLAHRHCVSQQSGASVRPSRPTHAAGDVREVAAYQLALAAESKHSDFCVRSRLVPL